MKSEHARKINQALKKALRQNRSEEFVAMEKKRSLSTKARTSLRLSNPAKSIRTDAKNAPVAQNSAIGELITRPQNSRVIYFLGTEDGALVKFGQSSGGVEGAIKRASQHDQLFGVYGSKLVLLAVLWSEKALEDEIKKVWASKKAFPNFDEIVKADEEVREYIYWLVSQNGVANSYEDLHWSPHIQHAELVPTIERRQAQTKLSLLAPGGHAWSDITDFVPTSNDYYTHREIIDAAREVMGGIDLDPASCAWANKTVKAASYFTQKTDGLSREWGGRVWLNPPFSEWDKWCPHARNQLESGNVEQLCVYMPPSPMTNIGSKPLMSAAPVMCIFRGRKYAATGGPKSTGSPTESAVILYFGNRIDAFCSVFKKYGYIFKQDGSTLVRLPFFGGDEK